jgi:glycosyltransferase involved in cell wall biosynthesis
MVEVLLDARITERGPTGIARYVRELAKSLGRRPELRLSTIQNEGSPALEGSAEVVRARAPFLAPAEQVELPARVALWRGRSRRRGVFWVPAFDAPCLAPGPMVITLHDANHLVFADDAGFAKVAYYRTVVRLACARAAAVLVPSEFARGEVVTRVGVDASKVHVTLAGVNPPPAPSPEAIARVRAGRGLPERYVAYVGNFKTHKNLPALLLASRHFASEAALVLVGGAEAELGNALAAARSLGARVIVLRQVHDDELWPLLAGAAAFAFPSRYEGFGLPPVEAMALGVPVVASDAASIPEVCADAALLVSPDDADGLGEALRRVLADRALADSLRKKGLSRAAELGWEACAERTARVLVAAARGALGGER